MQWQLTSRRNVTAILVLAILSFLSIQFAPHEKATQAELTCNSTSRIAIFPTIAACYRDSRYSQDCVCSRMSNPWLTAYYLAFVPAIIGLVGSALLRGTRRIQLVLLNISIVLGVMCVLVCGLIQGARPIEQEAVLFSIMGLAIFCFLITIAFITFAFFSPKFRAP